MLLKEKIANSLTDEYLRDQRPLTIRAIRPEDKGLAIDALSKVSLDSIYLRFFSARTKFSDDEMRKATEVDFVNVVALVAVLEGNG